MNKLPDGRDYEEIIMKNNRYVLYRNNIKEIQDNYYLGSADGKYYELYKYICYDEIFGGIAKKHLTFVAAYKFKGTAINKFKKYSSR